VDLWIKEWVVDSTSSATLRFLLTLVLIFTQSTFWIDEVLALIINLLSSDIILQ